MTIDISGLLKQLNDEQKRISEAISVLEGLSGAKTRTGKRKISAAGRRRIAAAQRARWAKIRAAKK
jgi:hypothetical protein